jgi:predicted protein tyrosine phosphatase
MNTTIITRSRTDIQRFKGPGDYAVISINDIATKPPYIHRRPNMKARMNVFFDDCTPTDAFNARGERVWFEMTTDHATRIATFAHAWWDKVETIAIHCVAGISRSTGVAAAIAAHFGQDTSAYYIPPCKPNEHCRALVAAALSERA